MIRQIQELPQLYDRRAARSVQESAACDLHFAAAGHGHLCAGQHGLSGGVDAKRDDRLECDCRHVRRQGAQLRPVGDTDHGRRVGVRRPQRAHHDVVADVLCRRTQRPHAGDFVTHQCEQVHADAVAGVSGECGGNRCTLFRMSYFGYNTDNLSKAVSKNDRVFLVFCLPN